MSKQAARWILVAAALLVAGASPLPVLAEGGQIRIQADLEYNYSDIDTENEQSGETTETRYSYFKQRYDVEIQKELFPYLDFRGGGYFELIDATTKTDGSRTEFEESVERFFAELNVDNPLYTAGGAYRRREFESRLQGLTTANISREEFSGLWRWRPVGLPSIDLDFRRTHAWDDADTRDIVFDLFVLRSRYDYRDFASDYTYTRNDQEERIGDGGSLTQVHNGGLRYSTFFFGDRLQTNASARFNYDSLEPAGPGAVELPTTSPGAAFYLLDDSDPNTLTMVDAANPLTNVNIGRNAPMNPVGVGLDFGPPTEVDVVHVLPLEDPAEPTLASPGEIAAVAGSFVWSVFISDDQQNWTEVTVDSAIYTVFDNRFEISFSPAAETRFVKVVTTPITTATGEIRIAEIQAFTTIAGSPGQEITNFTQTYNLGLRWLVSSDTTASFESFVRVLDSAPFDRNKTTLTNGVSVRHDFSPMLYGDARLLRTDTWESTRDDSVRHTYSASLAADYLPTLDQRLIYSGTHDQEGGRSGYANSLFLRTNADIYRDWSVNLDLGFSANNPMEGPSNTSTSVRLSTNIAPNRRVNLTIDYLGSWDTETGRPSSYNQIARFQAFWVPLRTLSLFASVDLRDEQRDQEGLKIGQDYSINWAPFPDGLLNFTLAYNQTIDTNDNESRILTPEINWQLTRTSLLTVSFGYGTIESATETRDVKILRTNFRVFF